MQASKQAGFSLIQLVMLMLIIGILAPLGTGSWSGKSPVVRAEAHQLFQNLNYVRHYAITRETTVRVTFNTSTKSYQFADSTGNNAILFPASNSDSITLDAGTGMALSNIPNSYLLFDKDGKVYKTSGVLLPTDGTITLTGSGLSGTVTVKAHSGLVTLPIFT